MCNNDDPKVRIDEISDDKSDSDSAVLPRKYKTIATQKQDMVGGVVRGRVYSKTSLRTPQVEGKPLGIADSIVEEKNIVSKTSKSCLVISSTIKPTEDIRFN